MGSKKKNKVKLDLLTDINMLLMVEKSIRGRICHYVYGYAKANNKYMKDYNKNKESSYSNIGIKGCILRLVGPCCKHFQ